ncbi:pyridoxamine 5'-phosphate oxidase family protein [Chloroflexota bacterium]
MNLGEYFDQTKGRGVLATADAEGKVNAALYARPHFMDDDTVVFIMAERLTHENLQSNPWATYIFIQEGEGYKGKRLYLKKVKEEQNDQLISEICRKCDYSHYDLYTRYLVSFNTEKVLPLIGDST